MNRLFYFLNQNMKIPACNIFTNKQAPQHEIKLIEQFIAI